MRATVAQRWEHSPPTNVAGLKFWRWRHMWVEFVVGFLLWSERSFSGYSGFHLSLKTSPSKFQFNLKRMDTFQRALMNSQELRGKTKYSYNHNYKLNEAPYKILAAARNSKRTWKTVIAATTTVETNWVENLKSEIPSRILLGIAREQALRGALVAGRENQGERAITSLEFEFHLQLPCGSPSTELPDFPQSAKSRKNKKM